MADNVTAATQAAGFDRSAGFGANEQKTENSDRIAELLDEVRDLMVEDGADPATAEALTNYARPVRPAITGNLADLHRMGQIAVTGQVETPPGEDNIETSELKDAFAEPPAPDLNTGLQRPMGQIDAEGNPTGTNVGEGDGGTTAAAADDGTEAEADEGGDYDGYTKAELQAELDEQGIAYTSGETKADLIAKLEGA